MICKNKMILKKGLFKEGFTLIELLVVVSIISLLSSVVLTNLSSARTKAINTAIKEQTRQVKIALELYYNNKGGYPNPQTDGVALGDTMFYCTNGTDCKYLGADIDAYLENSGIAFDSSIYNENQVTSNSIFFGLIPKVYAATQFPAFKSTVVKNSDGQEMAGVVYAVEINTNVSGSPIAPSDKVGLIEITSSANTFVSKIRTMNNNSLTNIANSADLFND